MLLVRFLCLSASSAGAIEGEGLLLLRLLSVVLHVLPQSYSVQSATASCTTATRLLRRWTAHVRRYGSAVWSPADLSATLASTTAPRAAATATGGVAGGKASEAFNPLALLTTSGTDIMASTVKLLPMLDRAHSWLRTVSLSRGLKSLSGPVKALMELVGVPFLQFI